MQQSVEFVKINFHPKNERKSAKILGETLQIYLKHFGQTLISALLVQALLFLLYHEAVMSEQEQRMFCYIKNIYAILSYPIYPILSILSYLSYPIYPILSYPIYPILSILSYLSYPIYPILSILSYPIYNIYPLSILYNIKRKHGKWLEDRKPG